MDGDAPLQGALVFAVRELTNSEEEVLDLFTYTNKLYKVDNAVIRFDPEQYPLDGVFQGIGGNIFDGPTVSVLRRLSAGFFSVVLSGSPSFRECERFVNWQRIRYGCERVATLVCWRCFMLATYSMD
jgi:hypothetical protein